MTKALDRTARQIALDTEESLRTLPMVLEVLAGQHREALARLDSLTRTNAMLAAIIASQERTEERLRRFIGRMLRRQNESELDRHRFGSPVWFRSMEPRR